jgi:hypothetical protein
MYCMYSDCARHNFPYIRGWMQTMFYYQMIYFPETNNTIKHHSCYGYKCISIIQCTITLTLCINVSWWCGEPVSCVMSHSTTSILHCLRPMPEIWMEAGQPLNPASLAYWCVTRGIFFFSFVFFVLQRAFFYFLCTVSGCDSRNRTRNIAVYTWHFSLLSYDHHPLSCERHSSELQPSPNWATTVTQWATTGTHWATTITHWATTVTRDICAPVSHSTVHSSPLSSGIHWIISCIFSWPPLPPSASCHQYTTPPLPRHMQGGFLATWLRGGWLGLGSLPSSIASFLSLIFSCVLFLALFRPAFLLFVHAMWLPDLSLSMQSKITFFMIPSHPCMGAAFRFNLFARDSFYLSLAMCVLPSVRLGILFVYLFRSPQVCHHLHLIVCGSLVGCSIEKINCAWHNFLYIRGWMQMVLYYQMIYFSWNK